MSQEKSSKPIVSVVVPCLNRANYLVPTLDSILQQDYANVECIVVDGGSKDGSLEVLRSYNNRIKWVSEPDEGPPDAINKGWRMSSGEILAWLNADDIWAPGAVSQVVAYLSDHPKVDVVYGDCGIIDHEGKQIATVIVPEWDLRKAVEYCDHIIFQAASFMRRAILERVGWLYPKLCHDHELWLKISLVGGELQHLPAVLAHARDHRDNLGYRSDLVVPLKITLTRSFFQNPNLPPELVAIRWRAISNAYMRAMDFVSADKTERGGSMCKMVWLVFRALSADRRNFPRVLEHLLDLCLSDRRLLPGMVRRPLRCVRRHVRRRSTKITILGQ